MTRDATPPQDHRFGAEVLRIVASWLALLALMATSLGLAYLHLGALNTVAALAIAGIKTAVVGWWFMHLRTSAATSRLAAAIALFLLAILLALSGVDYLTRLDEPAAVQRPQQIEPAPEKPTPRGLSF